MIDRPRCRSTTVPCTFIATSHAPLAKPRRNSPITTGITPTTEPSAAVARPTPSSAAIAVTVRAEPILVTTGPDSGSASSEPAAIASSTRPSAAESSSSRSRTCGIRAAQLANAKPEPMNAA
jgi:hypothetical protein